MRTKNPSGICAACGQWVERLELDHVVPLFEDGKHDTANLQWLCLPCHKTKTRAEQSRSYKLRLAAGIPPQSFVTEEGRERQRTANKGRKFTAEQKARVSAGCIEREKRKRAARERGR